MGFLKMFDKLDDIVYEPVKAICEWAKEPLRRFENERNLKSEKEMKAFEQQLVEQERESQAKLDAEIRKWNADIDEMIADKEMERRDRFVESLKRYQIDLATATRDIVESLGVMSIELRREASNLIEEKTRSLIEIQQKVKKEASEELEDVGVKFANNERVRIRMEDSIINNMDSIIESTNAMIKELSGDMARLNASTDKLLNKGMENIDKYLSPIARNTGLAVESFSTQVELDTSELKRLK